MEGNHLKVENCNKAKCKSCIFGPNPASITEQRMVEIRLYLARFEYSHICHTTNKTCYGAIEFQARIMHAIGIIPDGKAETFLQKAKEILNL
jgi:hypothetical protein